MFLVKETIGGNIELKGFTSEQEIEFYIAHGNIQGNGSYDYESESRVRGAVIFENAETFKSLILLPQKISYKIRLIDEYAISTWSLWSGFQSPGPNHYNVERYADTGFIGLQIAIDKAIIQQLLGFGNLNKSSIVQKISLQAFPYPPYKESYDFNLIYFMLVPQFMVLGFIFMVPSLIRNIVSEKETGIKELMKLMGLPSWIQWFGWMINSIIMLGLSITIIVAFYFIQFNLESGAVLSYSDPTIWWIVLMLYAMAATSFCFFVSTIFQKPALGTTIGIILWLVSYYVPVGIMEEKYSTLRFSSKLMSALLPNVALHWAIKAMCGFEARSIGAYWSNLFEPVSTVDKLSVGVMCLMFIVDTIIFLTLTIYFENIIPSAYGLRRPWYYPLDLRNWKNTENVTRDPNIGIDEARSTATDLESGFEPDPLTLKPTIIISDLRKTFPGSKVAVDGITIKFYSGQITALLGHNGAGKTTTMSMLTGLFGPTSGTAWVRGWDIRTQMDRVRESLGLCPQENMLFNKLTVEEHLLFFAKLKGLSPTVAEYDVKKLLDELGLKEKRSTLSVALSGGQKRKLNLGIALIGNPQVIILDEPTSGMDPEARRAIWDLLLRYRCGSEGPLILLSTHFMEEADVLGDRIAIMSKGKIKCCGSPHFLKNWYGTGYTLKMTIERDTEVSNIVQLVQAYMPSAEVKSQRGQELFLSLPSSETFDQKQDTSTFPTLFQNLEEAKETFGIQTIGLSLTTMDEVFFKVGEDLLNEPTGKRQDYGTLKYTPSKKLKFRTYSIEESEQKQTTGCQRYLSQFRGLLVKRVLVTLRSRKLAISQFILPIITLIITILLCNEHFEPYPNPPPLKMGLRDYEGSVTIYTGADEILSRAFVSALRGPNSEIVKLLPGSSVEESLLAVGVSDLAKFREKYIIAGELNFTHFNALFSTIPNHAAPLAINIMSNALLQFLQPGTEHRITTTNHPLRSSFSNILEAAQPNPDFSRGVSAIFGALVPLGLALYSASTLVFPVEEKIVKAKQLQLMTRTSPVVYWASSFIWDFFVVGVLVSIMTLCFPVFQNYGVYTGYNGGGVVFLIFLTFGFSSISFSYLFSLFVSTVPGGFSLLTITHVVTGMIMPLVTFVLEQSGLPDDTKYLRLIGKLFPTYGASMSLMRFTTISTKNSRCNILSEATKKLICNPKVEMRAELRSCCSNCAEFVTDPNFNLCFKPEPYLVWESKAQRSYSLTASYNVPGIGQDLLYLFLVGVLYKVLLLIWEYEWLQKVYGAIFVRRKNVKSFLKEVEDEDVQAEAKRVDEMVKNGHINEDALVVQNICKNYGPLAAVSNLSFGVHYGEIFGLLGVNGAGKTTTFRILTGDEVGNFGNAFASPYNLHNQKSRFLSSLGYCPQFDGIVGVLTGSEMLELFARLRGIKGELIKTEVEKWLKNMGLYDSRNKQCRTYSGGMKRRLSAAMALIGDPPIILLDEPTSGVDPIARRQFWDVLSSVKAAGQAVILTSHSMEECEALCSRLGIMVNGQFQCLGGVQSLKSKFALGFTLIVKLKSNSEVGKVNSLESRILSTFSPCQLKDKHQNLLQFQVLNTTLGWGQIFSLMEGFKNDSQWSEILEDYSVSETTLEEVFLSFARKQYSGRKANVSWWRKIFC